MSYSVSIKNAVKKYGDFVAVKGVNLEIEKGEFFTLLGPSGCGKTTLLRMIAGFNTIEGGEIYFDDKLINNIQAHRRDIGMVFQNYAVFPHMSVGDNVAYGLKARKIPKTEINERVDNALELVQIKQLKDRSPAALSGGQQQRVALARAFVIEPGVLLMDEPLSNLDAKLRVQMRTMIKKLQRNLGITTIYVTHDQEEALSISDRIAVMKDGLIQQVGKPEDIYRHPANHFVANFIGNSNTFEGKVCSDNGVRKLELKSGLTKEIKTQSEYCGPVKVAIRPEHLFLGESGIPGTVTLSTFLGDFVSYEISLDDGQIIEINEYGKEMKKIHEIGTKVFLDFDEDNISIYEEESGGVVKC